MGVDEQQRGGGEETHERAFALLVTALQIQSQSQQQQQGEEDGEYSASSGEEEDEEEEEERNGVVACRDECEDEDCGGCDVGSDEEDEDLEGVDAADVFEACLACLDEEDLADAAAADGRDPDGGARKKRKQEGSAMVQRDPVELSPWVLLQKIEKRNKNDLEEKEKPQATAATRIITDDGAAHATRAVVESRLPPVQIIRSIAHNALGEMRLDQAHAERGHVRESDLAEAVQHLSSALEAWTDNAAALMSLSGIERDAGDLESALQKLRRVSVLPVAELSAQVEEFGQRLAEQEEGEGPEDSPMGWLEMLVLDSWRVCVPLAAHRQATLEMILGRYDEARQTLQRFGFRHRISPEVWDAACGRAGTAVAGAAAGTTWDGDAVPGAFIPPAMFANAIPRELHQRLLRGFAPGSPYWEENDYDQSEYFSWWFDVAQAPGNAVEELIKYVLLPVLDRDDIVGAEWWVHTRPVTGGDIGHQLHFDTDERTLEASGRILHPAVSSVAYLSRGGLSSAVEGAARGGATVVFDGQTTDADDFARAAWVTHPVDGAFMTFDARLLHGVLPSAPPNSAQLLPGQQLRNGTEAPLKRQRTASPPASATPDGSGDGAAMERLTLLVGFWNRSDFDGDDLSEGDPVQRHHGARAVVPPLGAGVSWPASLPVGDVGQYGAGKERPVQDPSLVTRVAPAWESIAVLDGGSVGADAVPELEPPHGSDPRFFVRSPHAFKERLLVEHTGTLIEKTPRPEEDPTEFRARV